jgi:hypothetical protein
VPATLASSSIVVTANRFGLAPAAMKRFLAEG